jgi:tRNA-dihydrouridine synthase B
MLYPPTALILAPISGYTDIPYRNGAIRHGCAFAFTEMIDDASLVFGNKKTLRFLERADNEKWLGAQIVGSDTDTLSKAARIISNYNFDALDFNLGCPAPKVVKKGEGSALSADYDRALKAFEALRKNSDMPVSAKIRILDDKSPEPTLKLAKGLEGAGACAITVHGRLAKQFYSGPVNHDIICEIRKNLKIQVVANGGINSRQKYMEMVSLAGSGPVMLATGAMGNPWIFEEIEYAEKFTPPAPRQVADEMEKHILETCEYYGTEIGLRISRKFIFDYMKGRGYPALLKNQVIHIKAIADLKSFICEIRKGPSDGYFKWLEKNPGAPRKIRHP